MKKNKVFKIEDVVRQNIKEDLAKHLVIDVETGRYHIDISPDDWHEIFQTEKLNRLGLTFQNI